MFHSQKTTFSFNSRQKIIPNSEEIFRALAENHLLCQFIENNLEVSEHERSMIFSENGRLRRRKRSTRERGKTGWKEEAEKPSRKQRRRSRERSKVKKKKMPFKVACLTTGVHVRPSVDRSCLSVGMIRGINCPVFTRISVSGLVKSCERDNRLSTNQNVLS